MTHIRGAQKVLWVGKWFGKNLLLPREGGMQSPLVPRDWAGAGLVLDAGPWSHWCSRSPPGWQCWFWVEAAELWDCPNSSELALIFITFFAWAFFWFFFFQLRKIPWCCKGGVRRYLWPPALSRCPGSIKSRRGSSALRPFPWNCFPFPGFIPAGRRVQAEGTRPHGRCVPSDRIHLLLPGTFCCSDQWCEFHDLCTCMNFAVHPSGSSAFTFTVYFLVCLIRWLCWLYLNSLYFYAGF